MTAGENEGAGKKMKQGEVEKEKIASMPENCIFPPALSYVRWGKNNLKGVCVFIFFGGGAKCRI